ncbi:flagellar basal body P-ring protein FlgI [Sansalvadorimonas sp. 2012CJ34-2]|uniref:Flagellar P-ring protein n=1 Tax=Parendozoicomonas callyspongiae TaxID=2942213 RepID=A0ABT0PDX4_9GAMM|nr:flagellar basal body P-ring protein FlgI [Sansalvadorimonas sp. 2012CJ34-2]MCL6269555.1 flagellar basal body P-ring protein FlgI [Sansalvadorimonas sp. 2012CJ34-2]
MFRICCSVLVLLFTSACYASRLLDLVDVEGVRDNQLIGYGLVVGLQGTGDQTRQTRFTAQSIVNMLRQFGVQMPENVEPRLKNTAAVTVSASLPTYARPGQKIDVTVLSMGDAKSLRGGSLLATPLKGVDGRVYAVAQGTLFVGGVSAEGASGSRVSVNVSTVGRIPGGGIVERGVLPALQNKTTVTLNLHETSYRQARSIVKSINELFGHGTASAVDGRQVEVEVPLNSDQRVAFMSALEGLDIETGEEAARVVFNARTGTIVIGQNVKVKPVSISHGSLVVTVSEKPQVSQPGPFARRGTTQVTPRSDVSVSESKKALTMLPEAVSLEEVTSALNSIGATSSEMMAILQAMKKAGALEAELEIL